jgi:hypothetical protein
MFDEASRNQYRPAARAPEVVKHRLRRATDERRGPVDAESSGRPPAPAVWLGYQHWRALSVELYILTEEILGHPCGSTVSRETLQAAGFSVPPPVGETA